MALTATGSVTTEPGTTLPVELAAIGLTATGPVTGAFVDVLVKLGVGVGVTSVVADCEEFHHHVPTIIISTSTTRSHNVFVLPEFIK